MIYFDDCPEWVPGTPETPEQRSRRVERLFEAARIRFWSVESNRALMREIAKHD